MYTISIELECNAISALRAASPTIKVKTGIYGAIKLISIWEFTFHTTYEYTTKKPTTGFFLEIFLISIALY